LIEYRNADTHLHMVRKFTNRNICLLSDWFFNRPVSQNLLKLILIIPVLFYIVIPSLHAEGIKQLNPDSTYTFSLNVTTGGSYPCFAMGSCPNYQKLFVHVNSPGEKVYLGCNHFETITVRDIDGNSIATLSITNSSSPGYIGFYSMAYAGPNVLNPHGYSAVTFAPGQAGDFSLNFSFSTYISIFDVTVIDTTQSTWTAIDGRLWSQDWDLYTGNCDFLHNAFIGTQYIYTDDSIVTSVNYNSMQGWNFDVTSTANGCYPPPMPWDSSSRSRTGNHHYAQYKMFVNNPDSISYPTGIIGTIDPNDITLSPSCDGSVIIGFVVSKAGKVKVNIEVDPSPGHQPVDVEILDTAGPGFNTITWNGLDGLGNPVPTGATVGIYLSYINGLTNIALYDVEKQISGFIIQLERPKGPPMATYWNDTLLKNKGGALQLTGCYPILPSTGCHAWNGEAGGIGLGSENTVNTWWYASSSTTDTIEYIVSRGIQKPDTLTGPLSVCQNSNGIYQIVPFPLGGADPMGFEWVLKDVATNILLFDSTHKGNTINIPFSLFPPGDKRLNVRGTDTICGNGPFGPGTSGEGILIHVNMLPSVTNNPLSELICSGQSTNILLTSSQPGTIFHWTASLTSGNITGFSADSGQVINQVLTNNLPGPGVVTYHITPKVGSCIGTTVDYPVTVVTPNRVTDSITASLNNVCSGTQVTFTAIFSNPGLTPIFQWKVNGVNTGTNSATFTYTPVNGDGVNCTLTSSIVNCIANNPAISNVIIMTVNPNLPVSVTAAPSQNPVCAGIPVSFMATPSNGGPTPIYQWKVNGVLSGINSPNYSYTPLNGDQISCILTSDAVCPTGNPATSNTINMTVTSNLPVSETITASANPVCSGSNVTFTALPVNGGISPAFQWSVNGINTGLNLPTFSYIPLTNDVISCLMTSDLTCNTGNPATSNLITMIVNGYPTVTFNGCFDTITAVNAKPIKLKGGIPLNGIYSGPGVNPLTGIFTPSIAGTGTKTVTYSYTNAASCTANQSRHIIVQAAPIFTCGNNLTDMRDNKVYPTIQLGSQCWMASNLNYGTILVSTQDQRDNCLFEKYCYNDNPVNCTNLGALYQWDEMMQYDNTPANQGFCPPGWHIPTENDWNTLFANYINNGFAGNPLKYSGYSGFNALLSGENYFNKSWKYSGFATFFWSSTSHSPTQAWAHGMNEVDPSVSLYPGSRTNAFSVRCIKD
jgi:uncharacterized protein (TIGR02145 family)